MGGSMRHSPNSKRRLLNRNFTDWRLPAALILAGQPQKAIAVVRALMRRDPFYHPMGLGGWGSPTTIASAIRKH